MANPYSILQQVNPGMRHKFYDDERSKITPDFEYSDGITPAGKYMPAPYLPRVRYDRLHEYPYVLSGGKVVAMDSLGYVVPAGLAKQVAAPAYVNNTVYAAEDTNYLIKNFADTQVATGETVAASIAAVGETISAPVGISAYNYWKNPGGDGINPALFDEYNFSLQSNVAFHCDKVIQIPMVLNYAVYEASPFRGLGAFIHDVSDYATAAAGYADAIDFASGVRVRPGDFVSFDINSNYYSIGQSPVIGNAAGETPWGYVIGQVLQVDYDFPKAYLEAVRTRYHDMNKLEQMPGTATGGLPDKLAWYADGSTNDQWLGYIVINLINR